MLDKMVAFDTILPRTRTGRLTTRTVVGRVAAIAYCTARQRFQVLVVHAHTGEVADVRADDVRRVGTTELKRLLKNQAKRVLKAHGRVVSYGDGGER